MSAWDPDVPQRLLELHERWGDPEATGYHVTSTSDDPDYRRAVATEIWQSLAPAIDDLLVDYEPYTAALVLKEAEGDSTVYAHQDGTCNDEDQRPGIVVWIPVTPLDDDAGYLRGLWGSHRYTPGIRSTPPTIAPFEGVRDELLVEEMPPIKLAVGQALLFDSRLVHGSEPNRSGRRRVAGYLRFHPVDVTARHYWWDTQENLVRGYAVDREFFLTHVWNEAPDQPSFASFPPEEPQQLSIADLRRLRRRARWTPVRWDRSGGQGSS